MLLCQSADFLIGQFGSYDYIRDIIITIRVFSVNYRYTESVTLNPASWGRGPGSSTELLCIVSVHSIVSRTIASSACVTNPAGTTLALDRAHWLN